ncbi:MAG: murein biosynthesis integral membrane protein MurJ [Verrucomicrobia bacterium]|nr:murein biosynthesis integral membrane protein MurJ [Verrucomicrobiota bacterium]MBU6446286.1 murein biosynthesis integral membrane protein MurJ [Verrucomicrobiota bacterium]MDE3047659.1 murein biosynthesis integral membrane protein MurJ [Verrucomicrobiota bacterium]
MGNVIDHPRSITKSALSFLSGTALSRVSGLARDMSIAYVFGTSSAIAAFLVALRLANLLRRIFGEGALLNSFIPHFEAYRKDNPNTAATFFRDSFASIVVVLVLLIALIELVIYSCVWFLECTADTIQVLQLTAIILPGVLFICLFSLCSGLLQCEKNYFLTGISPVAFNAIWIASVWIFRNQIPDVAVVGLAVGITIAFLSQWLITMPKTLAILLQSVNIKELVKFRVFTPEMRRMLSSLSMSVIGVTAAQINTAVDTVFARVASLEGPAYLNYAIHIQQLPLALIGISISSALLPPLSRAIHSDNVSQYKSLLEFSLLAAMIVVIPCSIGIFTVGGACVNLIFGRGHFDHVSTYQTTLCLWGYGVGLIPMVISLLLAPAFYAKKDYHTPLKASLLSVVTNFLCNCILVWVFGCGPASLALSTSLAACLNAAVLYSQLQKTTQATLSKSFFYSMIHIFIGSSFAGSITLWVGYFFLNDQTVPIVLGSIGQYTRGFSGQFYEFGVLFLLFAVSFLLFIAVVKNKEISKILRLLLSRTVKDKSSFEA